MRIEDLNPDEVLASLLDGKIEVEVSETQKRSVTCYAANRAPNIDLGDEFIQVLENGPITSRTKRPGLFVGHLALTIYCKLLPDGSARMRRIRSILGQCVRRTDGVCKKGFIFKVRADQLITPTTPNMAEGYSTTIYNVEWRTI